MPSANFRFLDLPISDLNVHITGYGEPDRVRRFFYTACRGRHMLLRADLSAFVPFVIRELMRHTGVKLTSPEHPAHLTYSFDQAANGAPQLRIIRNAAQPLMLYQGLFFKWLRNRESSATRPPGRPKGTTKLEIASREAARAQQYLEQHKEGKRYSPEQLAMRKQRDKLIKEHLHRSAGAQRRHKRKFETPKYTLDEVDALRAAQAAQMRTPTPPPAKRKRIRHIDFSKLTDNN
jgi:hypothetical protein